MSWAQTLRAAIAQLAASGVADPARDARVLLAHAMGVGADRLTLHMGDPQTPDMLARFDGLIAARARRVPVSHLTGQRLFWGLSFRVTPDVLDPRPETETLVGEALAHPFRRVLDLGTGSGCILLSLLAGRPGATGLGADISAAALAVAQENATRLGLDDRAGFVVSDWCAAVTGRFDLIVSNPPYIGAQEMPALAPEVRDHEPRLALTDGDDGLGAYRALLSQAVSHLEPQGRLLVEIGPSQGPSVAGMFRAAGLSEIRIHRDMDGRDRVVCGRKA